jgi:dipeptidyl aminopeptidase/acylaminoacyl peptidase
MFRRNKVPVVLGLAVQCSILIFSHQVTRGQDARDRQPTVAESSNFTATADGIQVREFLQKLDSRWDMASLVSLGQTLEGRSIDALIVEPVGSRRQSQANSSLPSQSDSAGTLTVMILAGIHPGECDGKEACLALARDTLEEWQQSSLSSLRLIFVPNFNADGDSRRGTDHRPGQDGPIMGMGIRENAQGLDLNRDFVKLESPEVRSLVQAIRQYDVDVLFDLHTTNGSLHRYHLTYDIPHHPASSVELDGYLRSTLLPAVTQSLSGMQIETFYYGNFDSEHQRWESFGHEPRYSTEYMGLRGGIGILVESYSYAPYQKRIEASYHFVKTALEQLANDATRVRAMMDARERMYAAGGKVCVAARLALTASGVRVQGFQDADGKPPIGPYNRDSSKGLTPKEHSLELWNRGESVQDVTLPSAYAIAPQYAWAVSRLQAHGLPLLRLVADQELAAQSAKILEVSSQSEYQGHRLRTLKVDWQEGLQSLPAGTYIVPATGALGPLVANLLEPTSDDSLATWNFLDPYLEVGATYPVQRLAAMPESVQAVEKVEPGEQLSLDRVLKPNSTISFAGGNRMEAVQWLGNREIPEYAYRKDGQWYAAQAASGATRLIQEQKVLEQKLSLLEDFTSQDARAAARGSRFWLEGLERELLEHKGHLFLYDNPSQSVRRLTDTSDQPRELIELSPTGKHVAFVRNNDLWVVDCDSAQERRLTQDGSTQLLNGILDWVYQEELYGRGNFKGFWWSPDGQHIAFLQLDQTEVPEFVVLDSIPVGQTVERIRYPKAGQPNPKVRVFVLEIQTGKRQEVDLSPWAQDDRLVGRVSWSPDNQLWLQLFNRVQNVQDLIRVDPQTLATRVILHEQSPGWIEIRGTPKFLGGNRFLWLSDLPNGRTHLYSVSTEDGQRRTLTSGDWDVSELVSVSADEKTAFVLGNIDHPIETHLVSVDLETGSFRRVTTQPGTHQVTVDASGTYFIDSFSDLRTQPTTSLRSMDDSLLRVLSSPISDRHRYLKIQPPQLLTIPARDGLNLQAMLLLPWNVDQQTAARLPVLFHIYAGPQAPIVQNGWQQRNYWWHQMLCSRGYAVVLMDNRSARGRGVGDTWTIRGDLGRVELQDLEDAVDWVGGQPWADASRVGLWGWSYGGYMTAYAMTHSNKFRAGIAGAPVTDWKNYDSIYTERYMDLPGNNSAGYLSSSVVESAGNLSGRILLIHGERDDNVHLSNTLQVAGAFQNAGKQFDMMIYPKARHAVIEPNKRYQMHQLMTEFLDRYLKGK